MLASCATYVHLACFCVRGFKWSTTVTLLYFVKIGLMLWKYKIACSVRLALSTLCVWVACVCVCMYVCLCAWVCGPLVTVSMRM